jgi:hypothetical protein
MIDTAGTADGVLIDTMRIAAEDRTLIPIKAYNVRPMVFTRWLIAA